MFTRSQRFLFGALVAFCLLFASLTPVRVYAQSVTIQQGTTSRKIVFLMIDSTDHLSAKTGLTVTVTLSKNGGAFASPTGTVAEIGSSGWYALTPSATDTNTVGALIIRATASGADPTDVIYNVVAFNPDDAVRLGLTALPNANANASGGLVTYGTSTGQINPASGKIPATLASTDVTGNVAADLQTIKTQAVTAGGAVTFPSSIGTSTYAGGAVASVTGAVGSVTGAVTVGGYATNQDPATIVLGATASSWNTAGTIGNKINAAGGSSDPLTNALSGYTTSGTVGNLLRVFSAGVDSNGKVLLQPVTHTGALIPTVTTATNVTNAVTIDMTQALPGSLPAGDTVGRALMGGAAAYGKWVVTGTPGSAGSTLKLYAADGVTLLKTFDLSTAGTRQ